MKAMSLRIRMQTLSPCLTPSPANPPAMRAARSATSSWLRRRSPLRIPRKGCCGDIVLSDLFGSGRPHGEERVFARLEPWETNFAILRDAAKRPLLRMRPCPSNVGEARRALVDIGAHCLELIGSAHQFHLLDGFGEQRRSGIDRQIVQQALAGADRLGTFAGDLARDL